MTVDVNMQSHRNKIIRAPAPICLDELGGLRDRVLNVFSSLPLTLDVRDDIRLVLTEYMTNLIKHGPSSCRVGLRMSMQPPGLVIEDDGPDISQMLEQGVSLDQLLEQEALHESGMGLALIRHAFPELCYIPANESSRFNQLWVPIQAPFRAKIVVIDDDLIQLSLLESYLSPAFELFCFDQPLHALHALPELQCDLIICDVNMPGINGFELRKRLETVEGMRILPFIFLSGVGDEAMRARASGLSIDDFVEKPVQKQTLETTINRILNRSRDLRSSFDARLDQSVTSSLWNRLPEYSGCLQLSQAHRVASRGGGDFVLSVRRPDSQLIMLGDVMGHGDQAKFFAFAMAGYVQGMSLALQYQRSCGDILGALSRAIYDSELLAHTLVTVLVLELFDDGRIELASAGHPAPWLITPKQGALNEVEVGGALPGMQRETLYDTASVRLVPGEILCVFSDGLTECLLNMRDNYDLERASRSLIPLLLTHQSGLASSEQLLESLFPKPASSIEDDVTLVMIQPVHAVIGNAI